MCADLASRGELVDPVVGERTSTSRDHASVDRGTETKPSIRREMKGDEMIARRLAFLGGGWRSTHVPTERGDGLLLVGPGGVFALATAIHTDQSVWVAGDTVLVDGVGEEMVPRSRREAATLTATLSRRCGLDVEVEPVIVVVAEHLCVRENPRGVRVLELEALRFWLKARPDILTPAQVKRAFEAACDATTWRAPREKVDAIGARSH